MNRLYALLVGIDRYVDPYVPDLTGCVNDIDDVLTLLRTRTAAGTELRPLVLRNEQATFAAVVDGLRSLRQAGPQDTAVFWFSGHGSQALVPDWAPWFEEPTKWLQTLVCADSRTAGVPDLWDKELSVLLDAVADRAGHVAVVLDSCHSEGANREIGSRTRAVVAGPTRSRESLLPESVVARTRSPEHVALFACRRDEQAEERNLDGKQRGLFTWSLLKAMRGLGTTASYRELVIAAQTEVAQQRGYRQVPQLYPGASELIHQPFLGGRVSRPDVPLVMSYDREGWQINAGSAHGLPVGASGLRVGVPGPRPVCEADVVRVLTERSLVVPAEAWEPERERQFRVVLTGVPMPRTTVAVTGDAVTAGALVTAMGTHGPGGGPSAHVRPAAVDEHADLTVEVAAGSLWITDGTGERLAGGPPDIRGTVDTLEHLARWRQIRDLGNPLSGLKNPIDIEIVPAVPGVTEAPKTGGALRPEDDGAYHLRYERDGSGWAAPEIFVRLHNTGSAELYCVLLDLTGRFGVHAALFPGAPIGPGMRGAAMRGRRIRVSLPDGVVPEPGRRVTDWLVLVVAEKQFSEEPFLLPPLGGKVRAGTRNIAFHGLLERLGERAMLRDFGAADADAAYDWNTRTVRVVTDVPE